MENIVLIILAGLTLLVALLTFLSSITSWFMRIIPIQFGFLVDNRIVQRVELSSGDSAKPVSIRFINTKKETLIGIVLEIRFHRPLTLSGTQQALTFIPGKTTHGRIPDNSYYLIRYSELEMAGENNLDFKVELDTQNKTTGTYKVGVTVYSTLQKFKYKKSELSIFMK